MKKHMILLIVIVFYANIMSARGQVPLPKILIEYVDLLGFGNKIPDFELTREQLIPIMKGDSSLYLYVKNAPPTFKKFWGIKKDRKQSKVYNMIAFNITEYIKIKYSTKKPQPILIKGPDNKNIKIDNSLKKKKTSDWDDES
jgi:hypothetical protein